MPATVVVNNMTVVHKASNGTSMCFPDVCKTPSPAGPVPIPYPNVAMSSDTSNGSGTVKVDGNPIMLKSSSFAMSSGDEAGSAMGVASNKIKGKAYPKMYSFDVKVDGENVFRLSDIMLQNGGSPTNTPPGSLMQPNLGPAMGSNQNQKAKKPELTKLSWNVAEAACGDEVVLQVETKDVDDKTPLAVSAMRSEKEKAPVEVLLTKIQGNKADHKWISRRGPWTKTVELTAVQRALRGPRKSSNKLKMKMVPEAGPEMVGPAKRNAPRYTLHKRPFWNIFLGKPTKVWLPAGPPDYGWEYCYERQIKKGELIITRKVPFNLVGGANPSKATLKGWKRSIEAIWDNQFRIHRTDCKRGKKCDCGVSSGCCTFAIRIKCLFQHGPGKKIDLHAGANQAGNWGGPLWWYSHTWWEQAAGVPATVRPHEFGHLIGMYDEYPAGAAEASRAFANDPKSVMGSGTQVFERHFEEFHKWFDGKAKGPIGATQLVRR